MVNATGNGGVLPNCLMICHKDESNQFSVVLADFCKQVQFLSSVWTWASLGEYTL